MSNALLPNCADITTSCPPCAFTGHYTTLTPPFEVSAVPINLTTLYPLVTVDENGASTTYSTTTVINTAPADLAPAPTWTFDGVTLTAPTTYLRYTAFQGAAVTSPISRYDGVNQPTCPRLSSIALPAETDAASLIQALPTGVRAWSDYEISEQILTYLDGLETVEEQMRGNLLETCIRSIGALTPSCTTAPRTTATQSLPPYCPAPTSTVYSYPGNMTEAGTHAGTRETSTLRTYGTGSGASYAAAYASQRPINSQHDGFEPGRSWSMNSTSKFFPPGCPATVTVTRQSPLPASSSAAGAITKSTMLSVNVGTSFGSPIVISATRRPDLGAQPVVTGSQATGTSVDLASGHLPNTGTALPDLSPNNNQPPNSGPVGSDQITEPAVSPTNVQSPHGPHETDNSEQGYLTIQTLQSPTIIGGITSTFSSGGQAYTTITGGTTSFVPYVTVVHTTEIRMQRTTVFGGSTSLYTFAGQTYTTVIDGTTSVVPWSQSPSVTTEAVVVGGSTSVYTSNGRVYTTVYGGSTTYTTTETIFPSSTSTDGTSSPNQSLQPFTGSAAKKRMTGLIGLAGVVMLLLAV